ncbi:MAG: hypothetical protein R3288_15295, partial [Woeseiaceae bacterium]|nr:hypothetical protein [Woeseiaceae bacterium]
MTNRTSNNTAAALVSVALLAAAPVFAGDDAKPSAATDDKLQRGKYLVTVAGCNDCHTPFTMGPNGPEPDMTRMLSGHPESANLPPAPTLPPGPWSAVTSETNTAFSGPW